MSTISSIAKWPFGINNMQAIGQVATNEYTYNYPERPTDFDKAKQMGTELLHLGVKGYVWHQALDSVEMSPFSNITNSLKYALTPVVTNPMTSASVALTLVPLNEARKHLLNGVETLTKISRGTTVNMAGTRLKQGLTELAAAALIAAPLYASYADSGLEYKYMATAAGITAAEMVNNKYPNITRVGIAALSCAAAYYY